MDITFFIQATLVTLATYASESSTVAMVTQPASDMMIKQDPTPCASARWMVRNGDMDVCMLIDFRGTITYKSDTFSDSVSIPDVNEIQNTTCTDQSAALTILFSDVGYLWRLTLAFHADDAGRYSLDKVAMSISDPTGTIVDQGEKRGQFFSVGLGQYYKCDAFGTTASSFSVSMTSPRFQPFVQETLAKCGYGIANSCWIPGKAWEIRGNIRVLVGSVLAGLAARSTLTRF